MPKAQTTTTTTTASETASETGEKPVLPIANPRQFTEAWGLYVTGTNRAYVMGEWRDYGHRCSVPDPTYYRDLTGWNRASGISNPAAIRAMRKAFQQMGVRAPDDVEAAWKRNEDHAYAVARIRSVVNDATATADVDITPADLLDAVMAALANLRPEKENDR